MTINVTGRGTVIKDSFKETLDKKLVKFERFFAEDAEAYVTVINEGDRETVEITIYSNGMFFRSERTTDDRLDSLDAVVSALFTQITKNKSKLKSKMRKAAFDSAEMEDYEVVGEKDQENTYKIVRSKHFALKPMNVEEAILQMDLLGHSFFMFLNAETDDVNVVYKRKGKDYGLIEPLLD